MLDSRILPDSSYYTVIYFEKGVKGHKSKFFNSFAPAHDFALKLSDDTKYSRVHIILTAHYYYGGDK